MCYFFILHLKGLLFPRLTHLYMTAIAVAQMSKVKRYGVWPHSPFYHKAQVSLTTTSGPAQVLVMIDELFSGEKYTGTNEKKKSI